MYRSTFCSSRHYLEVRGQLHAPAALPPRKLCWEGLRAVLGDAEKSKCLTLPGSNLDSLGVQPVVSRYTDWAIWCLSSVGTVVKMF
jgi:hypothetical protein